MNKTKIHTKLEAIARAAISEANYAEDNSDFADISSSSLIVEAIEDLYTTAATCQTLSEWIALSPESINSEDMAIVTLITEVTAAVRKEMMMGVQGSLINTNGEKTWH